MCLHASVLDNCCTVRARGLARACCHCLTCFCRLIYTASAADVRARCTRNVITLSCAVIPFYLFVFAFLEHKVVNKNFQRTWCAFLSNDERLRWVSCRFSRGAGRGTVLTIARLGKGIAACMCRISVFPSLNLSFSSDSRRCVICQAGCL